MFGVYVLGDLEFCYGCWETWANRGADFWELLWLNFEDFGDGFKNFCLEWGYELSLG